MINLNLVYLYVVQGFDDFAEFTFTNRGNRKLIHKGFYYTKSSDSKMGLMTWRCALSHSFPELRCRCKAQSIVKDGYEMVKIIGHHTHSETNITKFQRNRNPIKKEY